MRNRFTTLAVSTAAGVLVACSGEGAPRYEPEPFHSCSTADNSLRADIGIIDMDDMRLQVRDDTGRVVYTEIKRGVVQHTNSRPIEETADQICATGRLPVEGMVEASRTYNDVHRRETSFTCTGESGNKAEAAWFAFASEVRLRDRWARTTETYGEARRAAEAFCRAPTPDIP